MVLLTSLLYNITSSDILQRLNDTFLMLAFLIDDNLTDIYYDDVGDSYTDEGKAFFTKV